jgi:hypothetical protein
MTSNSAEQGPGRIFAIRRSSPSPSPYHKISIWERTALVTDLRCRNLALSCTGLGDRTAPPPLYSMLLSVAFYRWLDAYNPRGARNPSPSDYRQSSRPEQLQTAPQCCAILTGGFLSTFGLWHRTVGRRPIEGVHRGPWLKPCVH